MNDPWDLLRQLATQQAETRPLQDRQTHWLRQLLDREANCRFGREHGFARLDSPLAFQEAVPIRTPEEIRSWLDEIQNGVPDVLFGGRPVAFESTSGSSSAAKLVPYSEHGLSDFSRALRPWLGGLAKRHGLRDGRAYFVTSPALRVRQHFPSEVPLGLPDGAYLGDDLGPALASLSILPDWIGGLTEEASWRRATLYFLVGADDLTLVSLWSPTFLLVLLDRLKDPDAELDQLLDQGGELAGHRLSPDPMARKRLTAFRRSGDTRMLWPRLRVISAWGDGSSAPYALELMARVPQAEFEGKGLLSTEGVVSAPLPGGDACLTADSGFYEFLAENGRPRFAWELEIGDRGEVVLTTASGLYRYRTGDWVECTGFAANVPRLRFLGRGNLVSDLVGEKLAETFVAECLKDVPGFRMLVPSAGPPLCYLLVVDRAHLDEAALDLGLLEARLAKNPQYAHARALGQLAALEARTVDDPLEKFTQASASKVQRLGALKVPALHPGLEWEKIFLQETP